MLLCYEVTRDLPLTKTEIETPMARMMAPRIAGKKLVFAPILRAGVTFAEGMLDLVPAARVAHIGLYREPESFVAVEYYFKAPSDLHERLVIVVSPVIATANTPSLNASSRADPFSTCPIRVRKMLRMARRIGKRQPGRSTPKARRQFGCGCRCFRELSDTKVVQEKGQRLITF